MSKYTKSEAREIARKEIIDWYTEQPAGLIGIEYAEAVQQLGRKIAYLVEADIDWNPICEVLVDLNELDDLDRRIGEYADPHDHTAALDRLENELESDLTWVIEKTGTWSYRIEQAAA